MAKKTEHEMAEAIHSTMKSIDEVMRKSGFIGNVSSATEDKNSESHSSMEKTDDEDADDKMEKMDPEDGMSEQQYESPDQADAEMGAEAGMGDEGMDQEQDMGMDQEPGMEEGEGDSAELAEHFSSMSDEELGMLQSALEQEMATRQGGMDQEQDMGMDQDQGQDMGMEQEPEMEKNYKDDYLKLTKSFNGMMKKMESLNKTVSTLSNEVTTLRKSRKNVASKVAISRRSDALEKSAPAKGKTERLNKSETEEFLLGQMRERKSSAVDRWTMIDLHHVNSDVDLASFQDNLIRKGVQFPEIK